MEENRTLGNYEAILSEKNGKFFIHLPDLSLVGEGRTLEKAYRDITAKKDAALEDYERIEETPPAPKKISSMSFTFRFVAVSAVIALTAAIVTSVNATVNNFGKYSLKTIVKDLKNLREQNLPTLELNILDALRKTRLAEKGVFNLALNKATDQSSFYPGYPSSSGAVDGIKDGGIGFYTNEDDFPWWEVDLAGNYAIKEIDVYNTNKAPELAVPLRVLISTDHANWLEVFRTSVLFGGARSNYLKIFLDNEPARWVRLERGDRGTFHLSEVEIYGRPFSKAEHSPG